MGFLGQEFNVNEMPESVGFDPIPAGWYIAKITAADLKDTKAGTGKYINVRYDVMAPSHEGRVLFSMITVANPNPKAEEIGRQNLGDLMRAIGLKKVQDTDQLIGGKCQIKVTVEPGTEQYPDPKNNVKGWKALEGGNLPMPSKSTDDGAPETASAGVPTPPWAKK